MRARGAVGMVRPSRIRVARGVEATKGMIALGFLFWVLLEMVTDMVVGVLVVIADSGW